MARHSCCVFGKLDVADHLHSAIKELCLANPSDKSCEAAESYARMMIVGYRGDFNDVYDAGNTSAAAFAVLGDLRRSNEAAMIAAGGLLNAGSLEEAQKIILKYLDASRKAGDLALHRQNMSSLQYIYMWR